MSFKTKIIFTISSLITIVLSTYLYFGYIDTKQNSIVQIEENLEMSSNALTDYIDLWMASKKGGIASVARYLTNVNSMSREQVVSILQEATKTLEGFDTTIGLEDGTIYTGTGNLLPEGYDLKIRPWYISTKESRMVGVMDAYIDPTTKQMCVSVKAPIIKDGHFLGAVILDLSLDFLTKATADVNFRGGYGSLLDSKKIFIAHPNTSLHGKELKNIIPALASQIQNSSGLIEYSYKGKDKIFAYKVSKETAWIPAITYDKAEAYAFLDAKIKEFFAIGFFILFVSICIIIFVTKILLKPLN